MFYRIIILFLILAFSLTAQEHVKSEAYKKQGFRVRTPLIKPKYPSYNLADRFVLTEKAEKGDPFAQHELGIRYILGAGVPVDSAKAAYWISRAASKNLPAANFNYAIMLNNGTGAEWNPFLAYKNFRVSAESGMEQGQYVFGLLFTDNLIVNKNLKEAFKWIKKSADKGFEDAKKVLEEFKKSGYYFSDDSLKNSIHSQNKSKITSKPLIMEQFDLDFYDFDNDSLSAEEETEFLNELLSTEHEKIKRMFKINTIADDKLNSDTSALAIINFAASAGSPEALLVNARFLEHGIGVKQNLILASANYLKAYRFGSYKAAEALLKISRAKSFYDELEREVKNNNPNAMYVWAGLIALGMDYSLTEQQAFELLVKAEKLKHINSIIELGLAYYSGSLVNRDSLKAIEYFNKAVDLGSSEARVRLAFINIKSEAADRIQHLNVLKQFSNKGSVLAQAALAYCYENGIAVPANKAKAARLYRLAAQRGNEAAFTSLRKMYDAIRPEDEEFQIFQSY